MNTDQKEFVRLIELGSPYREAFVVSGCDVKTEGSYYVYALVDPRDGRAFYIGKGKGSRMQDHVKAAKRGKIDNAEKHKAILVVLESGAQVEEHVFCRCKTEKEALSIERGLIRALKLCGLTNISFGSRSNAEIAQEMAKEGLKRILPLEVWVARATDARLSAAARVSGSPEAFYHALTTSLKRYASGDFGNYYGSV